MTEILETRDCSEVFAIVRILPGATGTLVFEGADALDGCWIDCGQRVPASPGTEMFVLVSGNALNSYPPIPRYLRCRLLDGDVSGWEVTFHSKRKFPEG